MESFIRHEWGSRSRSLIEPSALTEDDPREPDPPGFQGHLYPPQATLLYAMLRLEDTPALPVSSADHRVAYPSVAQISEKFSFGKTVVAIALVCRSRVPRPFPQMANILGSSRGGGYESRTELVSPTRNLARYPPVGSGQESEIVLPRVDLRYRRLIPATLVVAAASVIGQWEDNILRFAPHLEYRVISDVRGLKQFQRLLEGPGINGVQLVLVKVGKVTANFKLPGEPPEEGERATDAGILAAGRPPARTRPITVALARLTENLVWARSIWDDYDTVPLTAGDYLLPSLMTWVISATTRTTSFAQRLASAPTVQDYVRANFLDHRSPLALVQDLTVSRFCSMHCSPGYVQEHINSTTIGFRRILVEGGLVAQALDDLGVPAEVVEMINGGATDTAAERLGIQCRSIQDLLRAVLQKRLAKYREALKVLKAVLRIREAGAAGRGATPPEVLDRLTQLRRLTDAELEELPAKIGTLTAPVRKSLSSQADWAEKTKSKMGGVLERMRDNIREKKCQVCTIPANEIDKSIYIVNCCQIVVCEDCILDCRGHKKIYLQKCPNCALPISPSQSLVCIGANLDLEEALLDATLEDAPPAPEEGGPETPPEETAPEAGGPPPERYAEVNDPKIRALAQLVEGAPIDCIEDAPAPADTPGLLAGKKALPLSPGAPKRFLVFALHPESSRRIAQALSLLEIPHALLRGTRAQKETAIGRFKRREVDVLVATASRDCAGIHLPEATHVVFFHRLHDLAIRQQAIGRIQRIGREFSAEVVYLHNEAEDRRNPRPPGPAGARRG